MIKLIIIFLVLYSFSGCARNTIIVKVERDVVMPLSPKPIKLQERHTSTVLSSLPCANLDALIEDQGIPSVPSFEGDDLTDTDAIEEKLIDHIKDLREYIRTRNKQILNCKERLGKVNL